MIAPEFDALATRIMNAAWQELWETGEWSSLAINGPQHLDPFVNLLRVPHMSLFEMGMRGDRVDYPTDYAMYVADKESNL